jgi:ABC-type transport system involved in multi-copper enzyme maturation permease subunit
MIALLRSLLLDNPIVTKDANLVLRRPRTWVAWLLTLGAVAAMSVLVIAGHNDSVAGYWNLNPAGGSLLAVMSAIALVGACVLVPAFASSTIAGEREQGTLPLLMVTGLSPLRIVVGKVAAVLVVTAPFAGIALAAIGFSSFLRGVEVIDVLLASVGVIATTVCAACVGVAVSATSARARVAAPTAVLGGIIPAVFCALPTTVSTLVVLDHERALPAYSIAALVAAVIASTACIYGAWSALAPRSAPRFARATQVFMLVVVGAPVAVLVLSSFVGDRDLIIGGMAMPTGIVVLIALQVFAAGVARDVRAPSTWIVVLLAWLSTIAGLALLGTSLLRPTTQISDGEVSQCIIASMQCLAAASLAGLFVRRLSSGLAAVVGGVVVIAAMLLQLVVHEGLGLRVLDGLHFAYATTSTVVGGVLVWAAVAALALAGARKRPPT